MTIRREDECRVLAMILADGSLAVILVGLVDHQHIELPEGGFAGRPSTNALAWLAVSGYAVVGDQGRTVSLTPDGWALMERRHGREATLSEQLRARLDAGGEQLLEIPALLRQALSWRRA